MRMKRLIGKRKITKQTDFMTLGNDRGKPRVTEKNGKN